MYPARFNEAYPGVCSKKTTEASAVMLSKVAYDAVDGLINMVASSYTSEGLLK